MIEAKMDKISQENIDLKQKLIESFSNFEALLNGRSNDPIHEIRRNSIAYINENGFPTKKMEEWKYTNPAHILKHEFRLAITEPQTVIGDEVLQELLSGEESDLLVFVNGRLDAGLSRVHSKGEGIFVGSFADAYTMHRQLVEGHFAMLADNQKGAFTAMNTAFASDGAFIFAGDNVNIDRTIRIVHFADARSHKFLSQPRNLFILGRNARAIVSEEFFTLGDEHSFTNMVSEIYCGEGSMLDHYKIQNDGPRSYHVGSAYVKQEANSHYSNTTVSWGGEIIRNNIHAQYAGNNTECHFYGLYVLTGKQHVDNHTLADHAMPNCCSNELYKGILSGKSTGVFNGRILVRQDAQKTNAYQSNNCVLMSDDAMNYSKPQLEIFADDVKCSHGATTGKLSSEELFYLRSRGISEEHAKMILLQAFANDVLESVKNESLRSRLESRLMEILNDES